MVNFYVKISAKGDFLKKTHTNECKWHRVCPMKFFYDSGKLDVKWIDAYCRGNWERCVRYQMEERGEPHSDNMLPNGITDETLR